MKKADFYNDVKTSIEFLTGLSRDAWYRDGGAIVARVGNHLVSLSCNRNRVTLYTKLYGGKGKTLIADYNTGYRDNMATLTAMLLVEQLL